MVMNLNTSKFLGYGKELNPLNPQRRIGRKK